MPHHKIAPRLQAHLEPSVNDSLEIIVDDANYQGVFTLRIDRAQLAELLSGKTVKASAVYQTDFWE